MYPRITPTSTPPAPYSRFAIKPAAAALPTSEEEKERIKEKWEQIDPDCRGALTFQELAASIRQKYDELTAAEAAAKALKLFQAAGVSTKNVLTFQDFANIYLKKTASSTSGGFDLKHAVAALPTTEEQKESIKEKWGDLDSKRQGTLTLQELTLSIKGKHNELTDAQATEKAMAILQKARTEEGEPDEELEPGAPIQEKKERWALSIGLRLVRMQVSNLEARNRYTVKIPIDAYIDKISAVWKVLDPEEKHPNLSKRDVELSVWKKNGGTESDLPPTGRLPKDQQEKVESLLKNAGGSSNGINFYALANHIIHSDYPDYEIHDPNTFGKETSLTTRGIS